MHRAAAVRKSFYKAVTDSTLQNELGEVLQKLLKRQTEGCGVRL